MNWKQELAAELTAIEDLNLNTAVLNIKIDSLADLFGGESNIYQLKRELKISAPQPVNVRLIDGLNYLAGDFVCKVSFVQLANAFTSKAGDPALTVNGRDTTLAEQRPFTASGNWGISTQDTFSIGGDEWSIVAVKGDDWLNNEPAVFTLTLRK